jgi:hypothetical protein
MSRVSIAAIVTGYRLDDRGFGIQVSVWSSPRLGSTQPRIQWVPEALSPGLKRPGCEADHLPPDSAKIKKM